MTIIVQMSCNVGILEDPCRIRALTYLPGCTFQEIISCQILIKLWWKQCHFFNRTKYLSLVLFNKQFWELNDALEQLQSHGIYKKHGRNPQTDNVLLSSFLFIWVPVGIRICYKGKSGRSLAVVNETSRSVLILYFWCCLQKESCV